MVTLREFSDSDIPVLQKEYPDMTQCDIRRMIAVWRTKTFNGQYFELLAIDSGGQAVGLISLREQTENIVYCGIKIFPPFRRRGFAYQAYLAALSHAKQLGFRTVRAQVRTDNHASILLHKKVGFQIDQKLINSKGNEVYSLSKLIT